MSCRRRLRGKRRSRLLVGTNVPPHLLAQCLKLKMSAQSDSIFVPGRAQAIVLQLLIARVTALTLSEQFLQRHICFHQRYAANLSRSASATSPSQRKQRSLATAL